MVAAHPRSSDALAILLLLLLPAVLLGDSLFGGRHYAPYDLAEFLPVSANLTPAELAAVRDGANYDAAEPPIWFAPELALARTALVHGQYPHWNPYVRGGAPLTASGLLGLLNPLHWPALLFADPYDGLLYLTYVMFALAGVLMYGLQRELALSPSAALFGAIAFTWSGTMAANGHWYMRMEPLAMLPGMLWALLRLDRVRGRARGLPAVLFAVPMALSWSACFPPFAIPCLLLCGLFAAVLAVHRACCDDLRTALVFCSWAIVAVVLGLSLAGATVMQQILFFPVSNRPIAPTLASISRFAFDPMGLLGYLLPEPFAHPCDRQLPAGRSPLTFLLFSRTDWATGAPLRPDQNYNFSEYAVFPGTLPLLLAALGLGGRGPRWRLLAGAAIALLLLLASGAGPFRFAYLLPGVQAVPPYRFAGPACAFVALLAGLGFERLRRDGGGWSARVTAIAAAILAALLLQQTAHLRSDAAGVEARWLTAITEHYRPLARSFDPNLAPEQITEQLVHQVLFTGRDDRGQSVDLLRIGRERLQRDLTGSGIGLAVGAAFLLFVSLRGRGRPMALWLALPAILVTGAEMYGHGHALNRGVALVHPLDSPIHEFLRAQRRATDAAGGFVLARANPAGLDGMFLPPGPLALDRIRDLQFYSYVDAHSTEPFRALYGDAFLARDYLPQALPDDERLRLPWWDAVGLRYLVSPAPLRFGGAQVGPEVNGPNGRLLVYERPTALPRAWIVPDLRPLASDRAMVEAAVAPDFAPRDHALVLATDIAALPRLPIDPAACGRAIEFRTENLKRLTLHVDAGPRGYLVLADTFLPGWTATINGFDVPMVRGNVYQRVLPLPERECVVAFRYRTPGLREGLLISAAAVLVASLLLGVGWFARRRARGVASPA